MLSGYAIDDLLLQDALLDAVEAALAGASWPGRPTCCRCSSSARRCGTATGSTTARVVIHRGRVLGVAPKSYLPNYREFYERRQFAPGDDERGGSIRVGGETGAVRPRPALHARTDVPGLVLHVEICEDMWVPVPPSAEAALAGATVLVNLSGSPITVGRAEDRQLLCRSASSRCLAAYVYAAAGQGESTDRPVLGRPDHGLRDRRRCSRRPSGSRDGAAASVADVDLDLLRQERLRMGTFDDNRRTHARAHRRLPHGRVRARPARPATSGCAARLDRFPFVPDDADRLAPDCYEAYNIQVSGLEQRLRGDRRPEGRHRRLRRPRLDARADRRGQGDGPRWAGPRSDILAFTMPGFATSEDTKANAHAADERRSA